MSAQTSARPIPFCRPDVIRQALALLVAPGSVVELRCPKAGRAGTISGYYNDPALLAKETARLSGHVPGVYLTLNPCDPALLARAANRTRERAELTTADANIVRRRWLPIDIDPVRPSGVSSTDEEHALALERAEALAGWLGEQGWSDPLRVDSGNGAHLLYPLDEPNDAATTALLQRALEALAARFDDERARVDTQVANAARIWKVAGTLACKGDSTPDRPHRLATLLATPVELRPVPRGDLERLAALAPTPAAAERPEPRRTGAFDLPAWLERHGLRCEHARLSDGRDRYRLEVCPFNPEHGKDAALFVFPSGAITFKCLHNGCAGKSWSDLRQQFDPGRPAEGRQPERPVAVPSKARPAILSAADLAGMAFPEPRWCVPGLLPAGFALLAAKPKVGKSWLALALGVAVASGGRALGGVRVDAGDALYLALEDHPRRLQERLERIGDAWPARLHLATQWPRLGDGGISALDDWLTAHPQARLVIFDTLARLRPPHSRNGDAYAEDYAVGEAIKKVADDHGVCVLVIHHQRKLAADDAFDSVSGTTGLTGAADATLVLQRDRMTPTATLLLTGRDVLEQELALAWDAATCTWALTSHEQASGQRLVAELRRAGGRVKLRDLQYQRHWTATELDAAIAAAGGAARTYDVPRSDGRAGKPAKWLALRDAQDNSDICDNRSVPSGMHGPIVANQGAIVAPGRAIVASADDRLPSGSGAIVANVAIASSGRTDGAEYLTEVRL